MLSVLIPTYNYNVKNLVESIHQQLTEIGIEFEIIIFEDGSSAFINSNLSYSNITTIINTSNIGRVKARQSLANAAKYNWLLFLDADVLPKSNSFISNYLQVLKNDLDAIFGGFAYHNKKPKKEYLLRWVYGRIKEQVPASIRSKKPYKVIISGNFLIKKAIFLDICSMISSQKGYGYDNNFGALLKQKKCNLKHIDNEVYHLGIDKSNVFINKTELAVKTLLDLHISKEYSNNQNDLLNFFSVLQRYRLTGLFRFLHKLFEKPIQQNLLGKKPSITLFQLYKISYMCAIYRKRIIA